MRPVLPTPARRATLFVNVDSGERWPLLQDGGVGCPGRQPGPLPAAPARAG